jgi:hypothetical protein
MKFSFRSVVAMRSVRIIVCASLALVIMSTYQNCTKGFVAADGNITQSSSGGANAGVLDMTWIDNANNEDGFKIERKTAAGSYAQIAVVAANSTTYQDTNVTKMVNYCYRVRAFNTAGDSAYASQSCADAR